MPPPPLLPELAHPKAASQQAVALPLLQQQPWQLLRWKRRPLLLQPLLLQQEALPHALPGLLLLPPLPLPLLREAAATVWGAG